MLNAAVPYVPYCCGVYIDVNSITTSHIVLRRPLPLPCIIAFFSQPPLQGKLVRMIEGSTETVRTDTKDTVRLLLLLLVFAVSASSYVLWEGMKDSAKRSKYELLLHCILIVTSVIPPELPMQMALAVNSSLMALMKMQASKRSLARTHSHLRVAETIDISP